MCVVLSDAILTNYVSELKLFAIQRGTLGSTKIGVRHYENTGALYRDRGAHWSPPGTGTEGSPGRLSGGGPMYSYICLYRTRAPGTSLYGTQGVPGGLPGTSEP